ncbi:hypothetical protein HFO84_34390 [Rhizobium leguminosarum]|nr:hypothetical protein [Rhizobium leguminosarum]
MTNNNLLRFQLCGRKRRANEEAAFVADLTKVTTMSQIIHASEGPQLALAQCSKPRQIKWLRLVIRSCGSCSTDQNGVGMTIEARKSQDLDALRQRS